MIVMMVLLISARCGDGGTGGEQGRGGESESSAAVECFAECCPYSRFKKSEAWDVIVIVIAVTSPKVAVDVVTPLSTASP
jgi:hypothetical protein